MIRIERAAEHTRLHSSLCEKCPHGVTGCCASPPGVDWSDIGRILSLGGRDWLLAEIAAGNLRPGARGLLLKRVSNSGENNGVWPTKCIYHGPQGCTIEPDRRSATCNYYICDDAFLHAEANQGDTEAVSGQEIHAALTSLYGCWDLQLLDWVTARWGESPTWDRPFLDWVGQNYAALVQGARSELAVGLCARLGQK